MWTELATLAFPILFDSSADDAERARDEGVRQRIGGDVSPSRPVTADVQDLMLVTRIRESTDADARVAFDLLYERLFERLFKFGVRLVYDPDVARDVVQDAFVALWMSRKTWYAPGGSDAYLYTAVRNQTLRRVRHQRVVHRAGFARLPVPSESVVPDTAAELGEFDRAFRAALLTLPERRQTAFLLHAVDGLSYEAIGEVLGISKPAAFKQVTAAIATLRIRLSRFTG
jgi:RNA polymerase sigma factor (sigma-70 family)